MAIFGFTSRGGFACMPDFNVGCLLADLRDKFWNTEQLIRVLGEVDGLSVSTALFTLADKKILIELMKIGDSVHTKLLSWHSGC
jgi:hypothetical protein